MRRIRVAAATVAALVALASASWWWGHDMADGQCMVRSDERARSMNKALEECEFELDDCIEAMEPRQ